MARINADECNIIKEAVKTTITKELDTFKPEWAEQVAKRVCNAIEDTGILDHTNNEKS